MPVTLTTYNLGDLEAGKKFNALLSDHFKDIQGDYRVTLLGDPQNMTWELKLDAPDGARLGVKKFYDNAQSKRLGEMMGYIDLFTSDVPRGVKART